MSLFSAINTLELNSRVLSFFYPYLQDLRVNVSHLPGQENQPRQPQVPAVRPLWTAGSGYPIMISDLYLFDSPLQAVCFAQCIINCLAQPDQVILAALGPCPQQAQLQQLTVRYPNARIHTIFPRDVIGAIADCQIALWSAGMDGRFSFRCGSVTFNSAQRSDAFYEHGFSLSKFKVRLRLNTAVCAHKPKGNFHSFLQLFQVRQQQQFGH